MEIVSISLANTLSPIFVNINEQASLRYIPNSPYIFTYEIENP